MKPMLWALRSELKLLALWLVNGVPLELGIRLRRWLLPRFFLRFGRSSLVQSGLRVRNPELVSIGNHCNFGPNVFITGGGGVTIGDWVGFGPDVKIWSVNHRFDDPDRPWQLQGWDQRPVVIEDDVWLGANVFVVPGVSIGRGAIVAACSVVNKSIPAFAVAAGNPVRVVGWRRHPDVAAAGPAAQVADAGQSASGDAPSTTNGEPRSGAPHHVNGSPQALA
ncbi:MAG: acyltransferase [Burkholderiaceae bacterium]|nr:acyltransferase [Burkholderiaceae bacterium]